MKTTKHNQTTDTSDMQVRLLRLRGGPGSLALQRGLSADRHLKSPGAARMRQAIQRRWHIATAYSGQPLVYLKQLGHAQPVASSNMTVGTRIGRRPVDQKGLLLKTNRMGRFTAQPYSLPSMPVSHTRAALPVSIDGSSQGGLPAGALDSRLNAITRQPTRRTEKKATTPSTVGSLSALTRIGNRRQSIQRTDALGANLPQATILRSKQNGVWLSHLSSTLPSNHMPSWDTPAQATTPYYNMGSAVGLLRKLRSTPGNPINPPAANALPLNQNLAERPRVLDNALNRALVGGASRIPSKQDAAGSRILQTSSRAPSLGTPLLVPGSNVIRRSPLTDNSNAIMVGQVMSTPENSPLRTPMRALARKLDYDTEARTHTRLPVSKYPIARTPQFAPSDLLISLRHAEHRPGGDIHDSGPVLSGSSLSHTASRPFVQRRASAIEEPGLSSVARSHDTDHLLWPSMVHRKAASATMINRNTDSNANADVTTPLSAPSPDPGATQPPAIMTGSAEQGTSDMDELTDTLVHKVLRALVVETERAGCMS